MTGSRRVTATWPCLSTGTAMGATCKDVGEAAQEPVLRKRRHDGGARDDAVQEAAVEHGAPGRRLVARVQLQVHGRKLHLAQRRAARPAGKGNPVRVRD